MTPQVKCPGCQTPIPMNGLPPGGEIACPGCGKKLRFKAKPKSKPAEPPPEHIPSAVVLPEPEPEEFARPARVAGRKRPRRPKRKSRPVRSKSWFSGPLPWIIAGGILVLGLLVGIGLILLLGGGSGPIGTRENYAVVDSLERGPAGEPPPLGPQIIAAPDAGPADPAPPRRVKERAVVRVAAGEAKPLWSVPAHRPDRAAAADRDAPATASSGCRGTTRPV